MGKPPKSSHFNRVFFHYKPSILGVFHYFHHPYWGFSPYFWKHPIEESIHLVPRVGVVGPTQRIHGHLKMCSCQPGGDEGFQKHPEGPFGGDRSKVYKTPTKTCCKQWKVGVKFRVKCTGVNFGPSFFSTVFWLPSWRFTQIFQRSGWRVPCKMMWLLFEDDHLGLEESMVLCWNQKSRQCFCCFHVGPNWCGKLSENDIKQTHACAIWIWQPWKA